MAIGKRSHRAHADDGHRSGAVHLRLDPPGGPRWRRDADAFLNRGKRRIALDLKQPDDLAVALRLVDRADVLIENFSAGTMAIDGHFDLFPAGYAARGRGSVADFDARALLTNSAALAMGAAKAVLVSDPELAGSDALTVVANATP